MTVPASTSARRRHILVVTTWFPTAERPAVAPFIVRHVEAIARAEHVTVLHLRLGSSLPSAVETYLGLPVERLGIDPRRPLSALGALRQLRRRVRQADLVHTMAFSSALLTRLAAGRRRPPWLHSEHWSGVSRPESVSRTWQRVKWLRGILRAPDWLTAVSSGLAQTMRQWGRPGRVSVVPCVVDNPLPVTAAPADARVRLVAVGGLVEGKRPLLAVETVRWLLDHDVAASMTWVGDGPLRQQVEHAVQQAGLVNEFTITGYVDPSAVFDYYAAANVFFLPTQGETFLASAAEALTAGRPVVLPKTGGFTDYVDESNGVLTDDSTAEGFGRAIQAAVQRFDIVPAQQIAATVSDRFTPERVGAQFGEIYDRLLDRG